MCECTESGCSDDSPDCCGDGTCEWSWTGGGGGDGTGEPPGGLEPTHGFIIIALQELMISNPQGPATWTRMWVVFSAPMDGQIDMCWDTAIDSEITTSATGVTPGFPFSLGPFTAEGTSCAYEGTEDALGRLDCDGVPATACEAFDTFGDACPPFRNPVMYPVVLCQF
jgi:hypothetical protein